MSAINKRIAAGLLATAAAAGLVGTSVVPASAADTQLKIQAIIPLTGSLAFLSPPEIAGLHLAVADINAAGGVLGKKVTLDITDSGDGSTLNIADQSATKAIANKVDVVIGAAASGVTRHIINKITGAKIVQISMSNTAPDLSTWKDGGYYFRTAPSDLLQGKVIASQMLQDGAESVAIVYQDTSYGVGLKGVAEKSVKAGGGSVTSYAFPENETNFSSIVDKVVASGPDAVLLISYDESKKALPALKAKGYNGGNVYLVDGNLVDYSGESYGSYLNGAKGTNPGKALTDAFKKRLSAAYTKVEKKELKEFVYGAETYDAVLLAAIAAQAAKDASGVGIRKELTNVSKAGKGKVKVTSFKAALAAIKAGKKVDYDGVSGPIEFDANGDPTGAFIGIYRYGASGTYKLVKVVAGNTVK
jgi:branched-chain amino acid transport system substrate-binding protein